MADEQSCVMSGDGAGARHEGLRPWHRPELGVLPVDQTAASQSPGSDGSGVPTSS
ncbi:hypothetical protein [Novispirillum itersonii]|uniref:hypothetical protein n=1 Tax=Novispirillum itersonii TaxID=189 RepID=UPI00036F7202|nr:hypothetical protein [Novispirillum itersonii]